jgi:MinD-like ATPase involved in chromosome partitioning or flagellar assembly
LVAALGSLLALACPQPLIAVDMTGRAWGGLEHRVRRRTPGTVWDAARHAGGLTARAQVRQWSQLGPTGLEVLTGEPEMTSERRPPLYSEIAVVVAALRRLYPLLLVDLSPADQHGTWAALTWAAAPVLVARASVDSLHHTMRLAARMRAVGLADVVARSVVVVMATSPNPPRQVRAPQIQAAQAVGDLVTVPYDPALARPEPVDVRSLRRATRGALVRVGATVLRRCPADPHLVAAREREAATGREEGMS